MPNPIAGLVDRVKTIPPIVWLGGGVVVVAVIVMGRGGGGGGGGSSGGGGVIGGGGGGGGGPSSDMGQGVVDEGTLLSAIQDQNAINEAFGMGLLDKIGDMKGTGPAPTTGPGPSVQPAGKPSVAQIAAWTKAIRLAPTWNKNITKQITALKRGGVTAAEKPKIAALQAKQKKYNANIARYKALLAKK